MDASPQERWRRRTLAWLRFVLRWERVARFFAYAVRRFLRDRGPGQAAGLSYVSLLAIVPLFAVGLAILAGFPAFEPWRAQMQAFVLDTFLPDTGLDLHEEFATFVDNASRLTAPGLLALAVTALLLMANVNETLNAIWRVAEPRPLALRLIVYWAVLTLGPMLIGASLSVSSYAFAAVQWFDVTAFGGVVGLSRAISLGLSVLGFALIYFVVPNRAVQPGHALAGGLVAAVLFELLKAGFGLYLRHFPSYQLVYGAVSTVPIFLVWMYLSWVVALFGAEVAAALPEWRAAQARGAGAAGPGARLALVLSLLARLREASRTGERLKERHLGRRLPATPAEIDATLRALRRSGYVERTLGGRWVLCRDLESVTLGELALSLDLALAPGHGWHPAAEAAVSRLEAEVRDPLGRSLADLLDAAPAARPERDRAASGGSAAAAQ